MKRDTKNSLMLLAALAASVALILLAGCATAKSINLQPGDVIAFKAKSPAGTTGLERAMEFRSVSGNDPGKTNQMVTITVPTSVRARQ